MFKVLFGYNKIWVGKEAGESLLEEGGETNQGNVEEKLRRGRSGSNDESGELSFHIKL